MLIAKIKSQPPKSGAMIQTMNTKEKLIEIEGLNPLKAGQ